MGPGAVDLQLPLADSCTPCDLDRKVGSSWIKLDPQKDQLGFFLSSAEATLFNMTIGAVDTLVGR